MISCINILLIVDRSSTHRCSCAIQSRAPHQDDHQTHELAGMNRLCSREKMESLENFVTQAKRQLFRMAKDCLKIKA